MALFGIRFDFRNPEFAGTTMTERYRAGLDMAQWADEHGFFLLLLSEHHGSDDGYLPSALTMAAAMAARTERITIQVAALVTSLHDPVRLAEDAAVVDLISGGRLALVLTNGYVPSEFDMFGAALRDRAKRTTEAVSVLRQAWAGERFEHHGRSVQVTPQPHQKPPAITLGGSTPGAARRAARIADNFAPSTERVWEDYRNECLALGKADPGPSRGGSTAIVHLAEDVDAGWAAIAPHAMYETNAYAAWQEQGGIDDPDAYQAYDDPDELRASGRYRVLTPVQLVEELRAAGPWAFTMLHPLVGGLPPEIGWSSLRLFETEVLPQL